VRIERQAKIRVGHPQDRTVMHTHFVMTDQKSWGNQFPEVLLNLKGVYRGSGKASRPNFMSIYVQLSRAER